VKERSPEVTYEILIPQERIALRVKEIAARIDEDYKGEDSLLVVGVLKGATFMLVDLVREIKHPEIEIDYISISSYGSGTESSREPIINLDLRTPIRGKNVIVVEDIVDTGYSLDTLIRMLTARNPKSLKTCALLSKTSVREVQVPVDYLGFEIPPLWVEGYGLDTNQKGRARKDIMVRITTS
jgi:hypoxanthine phosphoribosyltransferase